MEDEARVARLIAVFGDLPNDDKDLVLRISEAIKQEVQPMGPESGGEANGGRPDGGTLKRNVQDSPDQPALPERGTVSFGLGDTVLATGV
jgi:hypothetical protein